MISAAELNANCHCVSTHADALAAGLPPDGPASLAALLAGRPHLYAPVPLFAEQADLAQIRAVVAAIDRVASLPAWTAGLPGRPGGPAGALMGFDFHLGPDGPQLIEINTNAGGALLAARAADALTPDSPPGCGRPTPETSRFEAALIETFRAERAADSAEPLRTIVILDEAPEAQFLYPEFVLYSELFGRAGWTALIADPSELTGGADGLWCRGQRVDLVYDRWTDFALSSPAAAPLRAAWEAGAVTVTPNPRIHASLADKRRLITLSSADALAALGADPADAALLVRHVPETRLVAAADAAALWTDRRRWFFKPAAGFGSRAAYRGDKLTSGKWAEILASDAGYIAQRLVVPPERVVPEVGGLKYDVRAITWRGQVQLFFARLYQGQTTNLRTPGGGFAAVLPAPARCG